MSATQGKPIGVFDSGLGGLTVARAIATGLPDEAIYFVGDTKRCPYGPREQSEVRLFVRQVGTWLANHEVKAVVIACNTATAAGLDVLAEEPMSPSSPFLGYESSGRLFITPHIAWASVEARVRLMHIIADQIREFVG